MAENIAGRGTIVARRVFAVPLLIIAVPLILGGGKLIGLGGSFYYLLTGLAVAISSGAALARSAGRALAVLGDGDRHARLVDACLSGLPVIPVPKVTLRKLLYFNVLR
jgi:hypothetical protein